MTTPTLRATLAAIHLLALPTSAAMVNATFNSPADVPVTAASYTATGNTVDFSLKHAPVTGATLTVINNTGLAFIQGAFDNLAQGDKVNLSFGAVTYHFVANYYGGTGNDLVLQWANTRAMAWGAGSYGQLGNNSATNSNVPIVVTATGTLLGKSIVSVAMGYQHSLALCSDGTLAAWGANDYGQLGNNSTATNTVPVDITSSGSLSGKRVVAIAAGVYHSLALCSDGTLAAWGSNDQGQLGNDSTITSHLPVAVSTSGILSGKTVVTIVAGAHHNLALCADGTLATWGLNYDGELGDGTLSNSIIPITITSSGILSGKTVTSIAAGALHSFAICADGTVAAWGTNWEGVLGNGNTTSSAVPISITSSGILNGKTVISLAAGVYHSLALCSDGTVAAWGAYGLPGNSSITSSYIPIAITFSGSLSGKAVVNTSAGCYHSLALCADGSVAAWGYNWDGQLGDNSNMDSCVPIPVSLSTLEPGSRIVATVCGQISSHSLAIVAAPPEFTVATGPATAISANGAALNGVVDANSNTTTVAFEYGLTTAYGSSVAATPSPLTSEETTAVSATLGGLAPGTTYHYRVSATNSVGTSTGADMAFTTLSTDANLSDLALGSGSLVPAFNSATTEYTASVATTSITIKPTLAAPTSVVRVNGNVVASGSLSAAINLVLGPNTINTVVTAQDGVTTKTYSIIVTRWNADLASLTTSAGTLAPAFSGETTVYTASVSNATTSMTVTPTVADAAASVRVNGSIVNPGSASGAINLSVGPNPISIVVSAGEGITTKTYNLTVIRLSTNADLASLTTSIGSFTPAFDAAATAYTMSVPFDVAGLRLTPTLADNSAIVSVNGFNVNSGNPSDIINLTGGASTISILVTAQDGNTKTYTLEVTRQALTYTYNSASAVAATVTGLTATGSAADLTLNFAPVTGTNLMVVNNTGSAPISGRFSNLAHGQRVLLSFGGINYSFIANYYGGTGNDLVLQWANTRALAWGYNSYGQLGNGNTTNRNVPVAVTATGVLAGKTVTTIAAGYQHSLALCSDGTLAAWGYNGYGQLGTNNTTTSYVPVAVTATGILAGKTVVAIAAGDSHSLALCSDGTVAAWGYNSSGRLGNNSTSSSYVPVAVTTTGILAGKAVVAIAAGYSHSLALCADGTLAAWGYNSYGQLGNTSYSSSSVPVAVTTSGVLAGKTVIAIAAGSYHSLALCSDGTLATWGYNYYGQLGNSSATNSNVPVAVTSAGVLAGKTPVAIAAGYYHSLALCSNGTLAACGYNGAGELGNGSFTNSSVPVAVTASGILSAKTMTAIVTGQDHSLALCTDGTLAAWGYNTSGQLGNNSTTNSNVPVAVSASALATGERFVAAASGSTSIHTLALVATPPWPTLATVAATALTSAGVTLNGTVNANSNSTTVTFEYGLTTAYGASAVATPSPLTGEAATSVSATLSGLTPGTTYHYRVSATNAVGTSTGADMTFATPSTNANLSDLAVSDGTLDPVFNSAITDYTVSVATYSMTIKPSVADPTAIVRVNGNVVASGTFSAAINLSLGPNVITTVVTAQDGITTKTYTVTVTRWNSDLAALATSAGTLAPVFSSATTAYTAIVANTTTSITLTPAAADVAATVRVNGAMVNPGSSSSAINLAFGPNLIGIVVTAQDGITSKTYNLGVIRASTDLASLTTSIGTFTPAFDGATMAYAMSVPFDVTSLRLTPTLMDSSATVTINGSNVNSGAPSGIVNLTAGANSISILVTAQDASTKTYTLEVNRTPNLVYSYNSASGVASTVTSLTATGSTADLTFNFAPVAGSNLMVVNNTGSAPIGGRFSNLAQGQKVLLAFGGINYSFIANYYGGTGNDLVLQWANTRALTWGYNSYGQLGNGNTTNSNVPVAVTATGILAGMTVVTIAAGYQHSLALCSDGTLAAWGYNGYGQLGNGTTTTSNIPVAVTATGILAGKTVVAIATGYYHNLALCADGSLAAWGDNSSGQLGNGSTSTSNVPVAVTATGILSGKTVIAIAAGSSHSLALCSDGTLAAWGYNGYGQLGNNSTTTSYVPVAVTSSGILSGKTVIAIAAGYYHSLALCSDGTLAAWGYNNYGQLGNGSTTTSYVPVSVTSSGILAGKMLVAIAAGYFHNLALCADGTLAAWGYNGYGQLGNNNITSNAIPIAITASGILAGKRVVTIAAALNHSLAVCADGTAAAWGYNSYGQLGNNNTTNSNVPVAVSASALAAGERFVAAASGSTSYHTLALVATPPWPTLATVAATALTSAGVTLNGTVNANSNSTTVTFEYGPTTAHGASAVATPSPLTGEATTSVSATLSGLTPGTTYHYRVSATNAAGTSTGADMTFATPSINANLSDLAVDNGTLAPAFNSAITDYTVSVATTSITLKPSVADPTAIVRVNGNVVASDTFSSAINLALGPNVISTVVTAQDGITTKTYTVTVTRWNADLAALTTSAGTLAPVFSSATTAYTAIVSSTTDSITLTPAAADAGATVRVNTAIVTPGDASSAIDLAFGPNLIGIVVSAADGITSKTYNLGVIRTSTDLASLTISAGTFTPAFDDATTAYTMGVPFDVTGLRLTPTLMDSSATVKVNGSYVNSGSQSGIVNLAAGTNSISILVTAQDASTKTYTLEVNRTPNLVYSYSAASGVATTVTSLTATGSTADLTLNFAPAAGTNLMVVNNTGSAPIGGRFSNLAQGQKVLLAFGGINYPFVANYYGGTGNDLVLQWANTRTLAWGYNYYGQLGNGNTTNSSVPVAVTATGILAGKTVTTIAAGYQHSLALCADGTLAAWGYNSYGQLGNGSSTSSNVPIAVTSSGILSGKTVVAIAAGYQHSLALCADGTVAAWGYNSYGQLGNGSTSTSNVPVAVTATGILSGKTVIAIAAGSYHSLALCSDGTLAAWGFNGDGELGNSITTNSNVPVAVTSSGILSGKTVVAIAAGDSHSLALCSDGTLAAWGHNTYGQLGNSNTTDSYVPIAVTSSGALTGKTLVAIVAGYYHSLALCSDGTLAAWGYNGQGQLGNNSTTTSYVPVAVTSSGILSGKTPVAIAAGYYHNLALCTDGTLAAWGYNSNGQLGTNNTTSSKVPVAVNASALVAGERLVAAGCGSTSYHNLALVAAPLWPVVVATAATAPTLTGATLNGMVDANSNSTTVTFEYGLTTAYGNSVVATQSPLASDASTAVSTNLSGLTSDTTYHYRLVATNIVGTRSSADMTFDTVSTNANLSGLALSSGTLYPAFSSTTIAYTASVANATTSISIKPTLANTFATVTVNGIAVTSGSFSGAIPLAVGPNMISTVVTAQDGSSINTYTVTVTRRSANANLAALTASTGTLSPAFQSVTTAYTMSVPFDVTSLRLIPTVADSTATMKVNGSSISSGSQSEAIGLTTGSNFISIVVTAQDGNTKTYTLTVTLQALVATYNSASDVAATVGALTATGSTVNLALNFAPVAGTDLTVVNNTGSAPINGTFSNLAQNQLVSLAFGGIIYPFVANYHGGNGNDLVLHWASTRQLAWGFNGSGQLGNNSTTQSSVPVAVSNSGILAGKILVAIATGASHSLALCSDGTLAAWGSNACGQLGNGSTANSSVAVAIDASGVLAGKTIVAIAAGHSHSLALCADGTLVAWGLNDNGQLGSNNLLSSSIPAMVTTSGVLSDKTVVGIAAGFAHSLALCADGTLAAWGSNEYGCLGNNSTTDSSVPVAIVTAGVLAGKSITAIAAGGVHSLALCADGTLAAWGRNNSGQLGDGSTTRSSVPVTVTASGILSSKMITAIAAGDLHSLVLCADGTLAAWGNNDCGQLGNDSMAGSSIPVAVSNSGILEGKTPIAIAAGRQHSLALCADDTLAAWGFNNDGQLGNGSTTDSLVPVAVDPSALVTGERIVASACGQASNHSLALVATPPLPVTATLGATALASTSATLNGGVIANTTTTGTTVRFEYGLSAAYGSSVDGTPSPLTAATPTPVSAGISGLTSGTTYHYRVSATNAYGTSSGADMTFVTLSTNADLSDLALGGGTLAPAFSSTTTAYTASVSNATTAITIKPTKAHPAAAIKVNGVSVNSGSFSSAIPLAVGPNIITTVVTAQDGLTTQTYSVTVTRRSANANLAALTCSAATLSPAFQSLTTSYTMSVPFDVTSLRLTPTVEDATATVQVNGSSVSSGSQSDSIDLTTGVNLISIQVTAENANTKTYTLAVTLQPLVATFNSAGVVAASLSSLTATGSTVNLALNFTPVTGTHLTVINNTGSAPINGTFSNLAHGQVVSLAFGGITYPFVANYFGGSGNDLVLHWANNKAYAWGGNIDGQLGNGSTTNSNHPAAVAASGILAGKTLVAIATGQDHSLALCSDGTLAAWGYNGSGQLGNNSNDSSSIPVAITSSGALSGRTVIAIAAGNSHNLALCADGTLAVWGYNGSGQLGNNSTNSSRVPVAINAAGILSGKTVTAIAAGQDHSLALCADGTLAAWGYNGYGQLGNNSTTDSHVPIAVSTTGILAGKSLSAIAAGGLHNLALCEDGTMATWGDNDFGQLGNGSTLGSSIPVAVSASGKPVAAIAAGQDHSLALATDGTLTAWGRNDSGQLGNDSTTNSSVPVAITTNGILSGKTLVAIAAGYSHSLGVCMDGTLAAWGDNGDGQLGTGGTTNSLVPVAVNTASQAADERFIAVACGQASSHSLALVAAAPPPVVATTNATALLSSGATLNGMVSANSDTHSTTVWFEYGLTTAYGSSIAGTPSPLTGTLATAVSANLSGLSENTAYHYRVNATNALGTSNGVDKTFFTVAPYSTSISASNTVTITGYNGPGGAVSVPGMIYGLPVTSIGYAAFSGCSTLTSVTIPDSITSIGQMAFYNCGSLSSLAIGNGVTSIADSAFYNCGSLTRVTLPGSLTSIGNSAFRACGNLTRVTIPTSVTVIGSHAFAGCGGLTSVTIPGGVTSIGSGAFSSCTSLGSVTISTGVTSIGNDAFYNCSSLTSVTLPGSISSIGNYAFSACSGLTSVSIPDGIISIGSYAFSDCDNLASVTIPNSVTTIGSYAFYNCGNLGGITLGDNLISIGSSAFASCPHLANVTIPASVMSIGSYAFWYCAGLTTITVDALNNFYSSADGVLFDKEQTLLIQCPGGKTGDYTIPASVSIIGSYAFHNCAGLSRVTIPGSVMLIGNSAFYYCTGLSSIFFQGSAPILGAYAFSGSTQASVYYLPETAGWDTTFGGRPTVLAVPTIDQHPVSCTKLVGSTATFSVTASGPPTLTYKWRHNNSDLTDDGNLSGATGNELTIATVQLADAGDYVVVVTNSYGSVSSTTAVLTIPPPGVTTGTANAIDLSSASLQGTVNPNGLACTACLEYGLTAAYGNAADVTLAPNDGVTDQSVVANLSGLQAGTTYHYRLTATNGAGTSRGADMTFMTAVMPITPDELVAPGISIADSKVTFTIPASVSGRHYQLQCSATMAPDSWQDLGPPRVGDGKRLDIPTPHDPAVQRLFYRLALDLTPTP